MGDEEDQGRELGFRDKVFAFLAKHPGNLSACARHLGKTRSQIATVVERFPEKLKDIFESHLDELEEQVYLSTLGKAREDFRMNEALKLLALKRPKSWGGKVTKETEAPPIPPSIASSEYILHGNAEVIAKRPERPKQTVIRVEDTPGGFFEDTLSGGIGSLDTDI